MQTIVYRMRTNCSVKRRFLQKVKMFKEGFLIVSAERDLVPADVDETIVKRAEVVDIYRV
jgi:hypothetical protein